MIGSRFALASSSAPTVTQMDDLTELLLRARDGDRLALGTFIRRTQSEVWRLTAHLVGRDGADDVTQDTFVRAWRALPAFRGDSSARTWLLVIARRACADAIRRQTRSRRLAGVVDLRSSDELINDDGEATVLRDLVASLRASYREAFALTQLLGCSYAEAAVICDVPVGTIRSRVARARLELVKALRAAEAA